MQKLFIIFYFALFSFCAQAAAADVYVAVNKANPASINQEFILKVLRAQRLSWEDGDSIVLLIDDLELTDSKDFDEVLDMSKSQFIEFWRIKFFSGRALIPKQLKSGSKAIAILNENKNSIYISIGKEFSKEILENTEIKTSTIKY